MTYPSSITEEPDLLFVSAEEEDVRIDKLLSDRFPLHSRTYFQNLITQGFVLINGDPIKKSTRLEEGDEIEVCFQATPELSLEPEHIPLEIIYEDEHLLVINKPAGMVVHPAPGHPSGTFANALLAHCEGKAPGDDPIRPGIVHRLDKDTSGLLIGAKTLTAHKKLIEMFSLRQIEKFYLAVCVGRPPNGVINAPIGRSPVFRKQMAVISDGKESITEVQTAACNEQLSLILAKPRTGRTHQIRVHLKHIGHPILGDLIYGSDSINKSLKPPRHLLHAYRLSFPHPITQLPMKLSAPIPDDLKLWMRRLCGPTLCSPALI